ncbi:13607_t:CDS:2, partial [Racocetra fulgida]
MDSTRDLDTYSGQGVLSRLKSTNLINKNVGVLRPIGLKTSVILKHLHFM